MNETTQNTIKIANQQLSDAKYRLAIAFENASLQMKAITFNLNKLKNMKK